MSKTVDTMLDAEGHPLRVTTERPMSEEHRRLVAPYHREYNRVWEQGGNIKSGLHAYANLAGIQAVLATEYDPATHPAERYTAQIEALRDQLADAVRQRNEFQADLRAARLEIERLRRAQPGL